MRELPPTRCLLTSLPSHFRKDFVYSSTAVGYFKRILRTILVHPILTALERQLHTRSMESLHLSRLPPFYKLHDAVLELQLQRAAISPRQKPCQVATSRSFNAAPTYGSRVNSTTFQHSLPPFQNITCYDSLGFHCASILEVFNE